MGVELLAAKAAGTLRRARAAEGQGADASSPPATTPDSEKAAGTPGEATGQAAGPLALVTSYRYFDDITVFSTVDLGTGRVVDVEAAQHLRTPLSDEEYEEAKALAKERSEEVKALYQRFGEQAQRLSAVQPVHGQGRPADSPGRPPDLPGRHERPELSPPVIDLTTRQVATPEPEAFPKPRPRPMT